MNKSKRVAFINVFLPQTHSNAGSKYCTYDRNGMQILSLFQQSVIDICSYCNTALFLFFDYSSLNLSHESITNFKQEILDNLDFCEVLICDYQITSRDLFLQIIYRIMDTYGESTELFYSGNHDHIRTCNAPKSIESIPEHEKDTIIFPTHYAEFRNLELTTRLKSYLGYQGKVCNNKFRGRSLFSFMICRAAFLKKVFIKQSYLNLIPRVDWKGAKNRIHHFCIFPHSEIFFHADGLSHIGIDNLICPPSNNSHEYNYLRGLLPHQLQAIKSQEEILENKFKYDISWIPQCRDDLIAILMDYNENDRNLAIRLLREYISILYALTRSKIFKRDQISISSFHTLELYKKLEVQLGSKLLHRLTKRQLALLSF